METGLKNTPGERCSCETITLSAPLIQKYPWESYKESSQEYILDDGLKIHMFLIGAIQLQFRFQRNAVCQATFNTFFNSITGGSIK